MAGIETLEDQVCAAGPFNAKEVLPNHAALAALIAGFALTAFVLLLDRGHEGHHLAGSVEEDAELLERRRVQQNASILLILAAIVGLTSAYLFSSFTGDHCMNVQIQFHYPSTLLVISATLMISGVGVAAASLRAFGHIAGIIRVTVFIAGSLMLVRIAADFMYAGRLVGRLRYRDLDERGSFAAEGSAGYSALLNDLAQRLRPRPSESEKASRIAEDLFLRGRDAALGQRLAIAGLGFAVFTILVWLGMRPTSFTSEDRRYDAALANRREAQWRGALTLATVGAATVIVLMASLQGIGEAVVAPPQTDWLVLFSCAIAVIGLGTQPPLAATQGSPARWLRSNPAVRSVATVLCSTVAERSKWRRPNHASSESRTQRNSTSDGPPGRGTEPTADRRRPGSE